MRKPRIVVPDLPQHVVLRGNNRRLLFSSADDRTQFCFLLARAMSQQPIKLHAMTLMSNHVHLLITPPTAQALPNFVKRLSQRYAQWRNAARAESGRLFEERYFNKPVRSEAQLAAATAYIELNPVRAGLLRRPGAHVWSSFALHAGQGRSCMARSLWTPSPWYLSLGNDDAERARAYFEFAHDMHERGVKPDDVEGLEIKEAAVVVRRRVRVRRPNRSSALGGGGRRR